MHDRNDNQKRMEVQMNFMNKLERKFSKYAVSNLTMYLIFGYVVGYILSRFSPGMLPYLILDPYQVLHGQVWRLVTWILIPPSTQSILFCDYDVVLLPAWHESGTDMGHLSV